MSKMLIIHKRIEPIFYIQTITHNRHNQHNRPENVDYSQKCSLYFGNRS